MGQDQKDDWLNDLELHLDFRLARREEADRKMKELLVRAVEGFFAGYPREKVRSLILTGAMSRGEGSCELVDGESLIYSDYDLLVVLDSHEDVLEARTLFPKLARRLTDTLRGREFCSHVDFAPITGEYFGKMKPSMFNVEIAEHGKTVWGEKLSSLNVVEPDPGQIPVDDALTLLFNRIAAQLVMVDSLRRPDSGEGRFAFYHNGKIFLDIVSCVLVLERDYRPTYRERLGAITGRSGRFTSRLPALAEEASFWTEYKLDPSTRRVCQRYSSADVLTEDSVVAMQIWNLLIPKMEETFNLCMEEAFKVKDVPLGAALLIYLRRKGLLRRLREYRSYSSRAFPASEKWRVRPLRFFLRGAPLELTYAAAAMLLFSVETLGIDSVALRDKSYVREAALFLPAEVSAPGRLEEQWETLREATTEIWRLMVKGGAY